MVKKHVLSCLGIGLIMIGSILLLLSTSKQITIISDGTVQTIHTRERQVARILKEAGISYTAADRIRPGLYENVKSGSRIVLDHAIQITLNTEEYPDPLCYTSFQRFGGNILLDAGIRLFPGDRLFWNETEIQPDFNLRGVSTLDLQLKNPNSFTLFTEAHPEGLITHGYGNTVTEALLSSGNQLNDKIRSFPEGNSQFTAGMSIEAVQERELTISDRGNLIRVKSAGINVGEALARAGLPLQGSDVSIPAATEPIPEDGRILIIPVQETFSINAEIEHYQTEWTANDAMELDQTNQTSPGKDGLRGSFQRIRTENGETVLSETSEEMTLVAPINEKREYGTKVNIRTLDTPNGQIEYYRSVKVYATSYSPCRSGTSGCITGTASGMKVSKGVAAVTSSWYNHMSGQSIYVPDYGEAIIADVGGGISGRNWIDLAYDDDNFENWSRETTIYFLTPVPTDLIWVLQ